MQNNSIVNQLRSLSSRTVLLDLKKSGIGIEWALIAGTALLMCLAGSVQSSLR